MSLAGKNELRFGGMRLSGAFGRAVMLLALVLGFASTTRSQTSTGDWPQFLGENRDGRCAEKGLLDNWPAGGPPELWRVAGGVGMSGLAVRDGRVITLVQRDGEQQVLALDAASGQTQWSTTVAPEYKNPMGDGPRATPTITESAVFVFTGDGLLAALEPASGKLLWRLPTLETLGSKVAEYGMASSPLVVGRLVLVTVGAPQAAVVAVERDTGKIAWKAGDGPAGYSSPVLLTLGGREQVVAFLGTRAVGLDPASGAVLWEYPYVTDFACNIATPLAIDGDLLLSSGENHGSVLLRLTATQDKFSLQEVWASQGPRSVLRNEWQTSILLDGLLYGFDNVGSAGPVTHLTCVQARTGKQVWQQPRFGKGNMIAAEGKLFMTTMEGEFVLARASRSGYEELGRKELLRPTRQAPSLSHGRLYLRDDHEIVCLDVRRSP